MAMPAKNMHEYAHFRGFNEFRAVKEQFDFLLQILGRHKMTPQALPTLGEAVQEFANVLRTQGREAAEGFVESYVRTKALKDYVSPWELLFKTSSRGNGEFLFLRSDLVKRFGAAAETLPSVNKLTAKGLPCEPL